MFLTHDMVVLPFPRSTFFNFIDIPLCFPFQEKRKLTTWKKKDIDRQKQLTIGKKHLLLLKGIFHHMRYSNCF